MYIHTYVCAYVCIIIIQTVCTRVCTVCTVGLLACTHVCSSVATILLKVYRDNILLSRHVSRYITISAYCKIGRVRVVRKKY